MAYPPEQPPEQPPDTSGDELLLAYLRGRDVPCPACGYDLRDLTVPTCPECRKPLTLAVGFRKPHFVWFIVLITPGLFSGICASIMLVPLVGEPLLGGNPPAPWPLWAIDGFGWASGLTAIALIRYRFAFLKLGDAAQRRWAVAAWLVHVAAFAAAVLVLVSM